MSEHKKGNNEIGSSSGHSDSDADEAADELMESLDEEEDALEEKRQDVITDINEEEARIKEIEARKTELAEKQREVEEILGLEEERAEKLEEKKEELEEEEKQLEKAKKEIAKPKSDIKKSEGIIKKIFSKEKIKGKFKSPEKGLLKSIYEDHYKLLLVIPILLLLLSFVQISYQYASTGDFVNRGVDLKGGITLTLPEKSYEPAELQQILKSSLGGDISVRRMSQSKGLLIEASDIAQADLISKLEEIFGNLEPQDDYSVEEMGSSLGSSFFMEIVKALLISFALMAIVVFISFRLPSPCLIIILAAFADIVTTLAIFNLTGAKLGKGGIAAFLMLIGYSVDTDVLLSTRVLKRKFGSVNSRVYSAIKTGMTMTLTTLVALVAAVILTDSEVIRQIMTILIIGLLVDILNTWITNVALLKMYLQRKAQR